MPSMPFADPTSSTIPRRALAALIGLAALATSGLALADTGTPLPQGYTGDVNAAPQQAPAAQQAAYPEDGQQAQDAQQAPDAQQPQQAQAQDAQAQDGYADDDPSALTDFQQPLAGYGNWVQDPTYGTIWVPDSTQVGADFAPYQSAGQWGMADSGDWMWQSDYAWGYIPFHYGRWVWAGGYWGWIPGRTYAPAWVSWRVGDGGYLGWAPLPPTWYWGPRGYAVGLGRAPWAAYCFVPTAYAFNHGVGAYVIHDHGMVQAAGSSTRLYTPASPGIGHGVSQGPHGRAYPGSPSLAEARVPASAAPHNRVSADPRAMGYASRSGTAAMQRGSLARGRTQYDGFGRSRTPSLRTPSTSESYHANGSGSYYHQGGSYYHASTPAYSGQHYATPQTSRPRGSNASRPAYHAPSSAHSSAGHSGGHSGGGHR
jgi:hypothetical protein